MKAFISLYFFVFLALASSFASASDPNPLQDFCVAIDDTNLNVLVNGKFCKNPKYVTADDFFFRGLDIPRPTNNPVGSNVTAESTLHVGFVTSNPNNTLFSKILNPGDVFVFPIGLIHFQVNIGKINAVAFAGLSSQNPGVITIANAVFGSNPPINPFDLSRAFQLDLNVVKDLQAKFGTRLKAWIRQKQELCLESGCPFQADDLCRSVSDIATVTKPSSSDGLNEAKHKIGGDRSTQTIYQTAGGCLSTASPSKHTGADKPSKKKE
ncbi:hypothetical protein JRO89_XS04G0141800 [Xanthoceras sorbifolium]|uniref:Germin-like protein n=1 Tax=Xanthoceras sorbifolium TaxID=99658 RepID=A0ABQ8I583_9ROSI|nr:hypothetical protein JRO89_XS04G0141800 [Xanthoceras sorbifolium]